MNDADTCYPHRLSPQGVHCLCEGVSCRHLRPNGIPVLSERLPNAAALGEGAAATVRYKVSGVVVVTNALDRSG